MQNVSSNTVFVAAVLSLTKPLFGSRQVAAPITFKTQKPGCGKRLRGTSANHPAGLWIREIFSIHKWWKGAGILPFLGGKLESFKKRKHFCCLGEDAHRCNPTIINQICFTLSEFGEMDFSTAFFKVDPAAGVKLK